MSPILVSLLPIFLLISLGYGLKRTSFDSDNFWFSLERLIYFVLFPALIIDSLEKADLSSLNIIPMSAALVLATVAISGIVILIKKLVSADGPDFASIFMGATRFNTYVGIAAASALYGDEGLVLAALTIAVLVPLVNFLSVLVLIKYASATDEHNFWRATIWPLVTNPLIVASGIGIFLNAMSWQLPVGIDATISALGLAALPLGLLAVGAGLKTEIIGAAKIPLAWASAFKLVAMPAAMLVTCRFLGLTGLPAHIAILFAALPSASTAYIIARQMGGNAPLMAGIITITTLIAAITMPLIMAYVKMSAALA